jgi:hypothetical protein
MSNLIQAYSTRWTGQDGTRYVIQAHAKERSDGTWEGWLEFHPIDGTKPVLRTEQETSQPSRITIEYWASGLEPAYFKGAFARAQGVLP